MFRQNNSTMKQQTDTAIDNKQYIYIYMCIYIYMYIYMSMYMCIYTYIYM